MNNRFKFPLLLVLVLIFPHAGLADFDADESISKRGSINDDYYAAGGTIDIDAEIIGDAIIAGGELFIGHHIHGDLLAAGGQLILRGKIDDDARVSGGEIILNADIGDDLAASGGEIRIEPEVIIGGDAWLAGGEVIMAGTVNKDLKIAGGKVVLSGTVFGDVELEGGEIEVLKTAVIEGDLHYRSNTEGGIHSEAKIAGEIHYEEPEWDHSFGGFSLFMSLTLIIAAGLLYWLFPGFTLSSAGRIKSSSWKSLGLGFALLVLTPVTAVLLMSIVIGVWVGLSILALYFIALLVGFLISCFFIGDWAARLVNKEVDSTGKRILWVAITIVVVGLMQLIPVIGALVIVVLLLAGLGAGVMQMVDNYRQAGENR